MTINYLISRGVSYKVQKWEQNDEEQYYILPPYIYNVDFIGGIFMLVVGYLSSQKVFRGRRMTLISLAIMFVTAWNMIWVIGSNIYEIEADNRSSKSSYSENDLNRFDQFMYRGEIALTFLVYNLILLAGPLDISKIYML